MRPHFTTHSVLGNMQSGKEKTTEPCLDLQQG